MAKNEKRILMPFDNLQTGKETEASKAGNTKKGDTKSNPPKGKGNNKETSTKNNKNTKTKSKNIPITNTKTMQEKKKPEFVKGGKTVKKKK